VKATLAGGKEQTGGDRRGHPGIDERRSPSMTHAASTAGYQWQELHLVARAKDVFLGGPVAIDHDHDRASVDFQGCHELLNRLPWLNPNQFLTSQTTLQPADRDDFNCLVHVLRTASSSTGRELTVRHPSSCSLSTNRSVSRTTCLSMLPTSTLLHRKAALPSAPRPRSPPHNRPYADRNRPRARRYLRVRR
jgi:hypothetical protein